MKTMNTSDSLQQAFHFTDDDLRENRAGRLSASQITALRAGASRGLYVSILVLLGIGLLTLMSISNNANELTVMLIALAIPAFFAMNRTTNRTNRAIAEGLQRISGQAYISTPPAGFNPPLPPDKLTLVADTWSFRSVGMYTLIVEDKVFSLTHDEHAALVPLFYTIYYLPRLGKIVSLESVPISDEKLKRLMPEEAPVPTPMVGGSFLPDASGPESESLKG